MSDDDDGDDFIFNKDEDVSPPSSPSSFDGYKSQRDLAFEQFHFENPKVYTELVVLARTAKQKGYNRIGIRMLWEVIRWNHMIQTNPDPEGTEFKLNDHYHSRYARLVMDKEPDLVGIFELRELKS